MNLRDVLKALELKFKIKLILHKSVEIAKIKAFETVSYSLYMLKEKPIVLMKEVYNVKIEDYVSLDIKFLNSLIDYITSKRFTEDVGI